TLRQAILDANSDVDIDTITITATGTISLESDLPPLTEPVNIVGPGAADLTIDANGYDVFAIPAPVAVSISALTITEAGTTNFIGGIHNAAGSLTLTDLEVSNSWQGLSLTGGSVNATNVSLVNNADS